MTNEIKYIFVVVIYKLDKNRRRTSIQSISSGVSNNEEH